MTTTQPIVARPSILGEIMPPNQPAESDARSQFAQAWRVAGLRSAAEMRSEWDEMQSLWIAAKTRKSKSEHTRRNYESAVLRWKEFLTTQLNRNGYPLELWEVESRHVATWQTHLAANGLGENSINHKLSCVSSYYSYVIEAKTMANGRQVSLFIDSVGHTMANPFKTGNIQRAKIDPYGHAKPLGRENTAKLLSYLEIKEHLATLNGARNYALILTYLLTAYRNAEVLRMRWADIRPSNSKPGGVIYHWRGKGAKAESEELPPIAWRAFVAYLEIAGRWHHGVPLEKQPLHPDEHIWLPVSTHATGNLRNQKNRPLKANQPINGKTALRILRTALRNAGVANPHTYDIHGLRHTNARMRVEQGDNIRDIQKDLHHSSLDTTDRYVRSKALQNDPIDAGKTDKLYSQMRFI